MRWFDLSIAMLLSASVQAQWFERSFDVMGTRASVEIWHDNAAYAEESMKIVEAEMRRIDATMSPYKSDSELSTINRSAFAQTLTISDELFQLIQRSTTFSDMSGGAFDITFSSVGFLYDYRARQKPDENQIRKNLPSINYRHVVLDAKHKTIRFSYQGTRIDLGGIAKGHAVDRCITLLKDRGIRSAFVNAGGDSYVLGDRQGRPWFIAIKHPRDKTRTLASLPLSNLAVSTSGDYERYFDAEDGTRYHHIINPKTGDSARESQSVTILADESTMADGLSTTVFVLGPEQGLALINSLKNVSAIIVDKQGKVHYSDDLVLAKE